VITARDLGAVGETTLTMIDGETRTDLPAIVRRAEPPTLLYAEKFGTDGP
jgi:hypothetical protein